MRARQRTDNPLRVIKKNSELYAGCRIALPLFTAEISVKIQSMKRLLFFLLLLPVLLPAQTAWPVSDTLPPGATHIWLPAELQDHYFHRSELVITRDADYKALFADSVKPKLPKIDFTRQELVGKSYCMQCIVNCNYHPQCHRNACRYSRSWFLLDKKHRVNLAVDTLNGNACGYFPGFTDEIICRDDSSFSVLQQACPSLKKDSVDFNREIVLARGISFDCLAQVKHEFYLDTAQQCLVWRLYFSDGGCRGLTSRYYIFSLTKPPDGYNIRFEEYDLNRER